MENIADDEWEAIFKEISKESLLSDEADTVKTIPVVMEKKHNPFEEFIKALKEDREMYEGYMANLTGAYYDESCRHYTGIAHSILRTIAHNAAENFLNLLTKDYH